MGWWEAAWAAVAAAATLAVTWVAAEGWWEAAWAAATMAVNWEVAPVWEEKEWEAVALRTAAVGREAAADNAVAKEKAG